VLEQRLFQGTLRHNRKGKGKMASLAEIRAKLQEMESRGSNNSGGGRDNAIYPHWNIPENSTARIRFLPDGDDKNMFFWVERAMIRLPFAGVKGQVGSKPVVVQVPCVEMWNETCPILTEVRTWFKDKSLEDMGRKYWKKRSYIFQGFVRENPLADDTTPENPIRRFVVSPSIFPVVTAVLKDTEVEELPTDYDRGLDFSITKTTKGQYADYSTSKWARKESALTAMERAAIEAHGLHDLKGFLPKKPGESELKIMKEMFEASVDGAMYDESRWGQFFKPAGFNSNPDAEISSAPAPRSTANATAAAIIQRPVVEDVAPFETDEEVAVASAPVSTDAPKTSNPRADEILAMIRSRKT
jgi:hypothetical protein